MNVYGKYNRNGWNSSQDDEKMQAFNQCLTDLGLGTRRYIDIEDGEKYPVTNYQHHPGEVSGSYGIAAGGGLVVVMIEDHEEAANSGILDILPKTFTIKSPHGDESRLYNVESEVGTEIEKATGNREFAVTSWGQVWVDDLYAMGPGSQIDASGCDKDGCDACGLGGAGYYEVSNVPKPPITTISTNTLIQAARAGDGMFEYPL